jgi:hypothetical protein
MTTKKLQTLRLYKSFLKWFVIITLVFTIPEIIVNQIYFGFLQGINNSSYGILLGSYFRNIIYIVRSIIIFTFPIWFLFAGKAWLDYSLGGKIEKKQIYIVLLDIIGILGYTYILYFLHRYFNIV